MDADEGETASMQDILEELDRYCHDRDAQGACDQEGDSEVRLNVYDMVQMNGYIAKLGIGAFHSGVEIYGREYAYGGHPYAYTGIYDVRPRTAGEVTGDTVKFRESINMGRTNMSRDEVVEMVRGLGRDYNGVAYHILNRNCNHFSSDLCQRLCGREIPQWVNRLPYLVSWMPFLLRCLPPSWLNPAAAANGSDQNGAAAASGANNRRTSGGSGFTIYSSFFSRAPIPPHPHGGNAGSREGTGTRRQSQEEERR